MLRATRGRGSRCRPRSQRFPGFSCLALLNGGFLSVGRSLCDDRREMVRPATNWRRQALGGVGLVVLFFSGCATPPGPPTVQAAPPQEAIRARTPPEWRPGDQWVYTWTSGRTSGTKSVEVLEIREINTVSFYLVRIG